MEDEIIIKDYCKDVDEWPDRWKRLPEDVAYGEKLLKEIIPFMKFLVSKKYTKRTLKKHFDKLWLFGGELIEDINKEDELRELNALDLLLENIDSSGGPYSKHLDTENDFDSFDTTCRKFYKFIIQSKRISSRDVRAHH